MRIAIVENTWITHDGQVGVVLHKLIRDGSATFFPDLNQRMQPDLVKAVLRREVPQKIAADAHGLSLARAWLAVIWRSGCTACLQGRLRRLAPACLRFF